MKSPHSVGDAPSSKRASIRTIKFCIFFSKWIFLIVGGLVTTLLFCLYLIGWTVGNLSIGQVSSKLFEMSPSQIVSGLKQLGRAKGLIKEPPLVPIPTPAGTRDLRWEQDLDYLNICVAQLHAVAWKYTTPEKFSAEIDRLKDRISALTDHGIACEISRVLATIGDGHTGCGTSQTHFPFRTLPIKVRLFPEGAFIVSATKEYRELIGCQITQVDSVPIMEVAKKTGPWFSAENRLADIINFESAMEHVDFLFAAGVSKLSDRVSLELVDSHGKSRKQELIGAAIHSQQEWQNAERLPPFLLDSDKDFWHKYFQDHGLMYVKYNRCRDHGGFANLTREIEQVLNAERIEYFVIDLRRNAGGDSSVIAPLINLLVERGLCHRGRLYVITDRYTFSSGFHNLLTLKGLHAIHLGEASSQKLNYGGEIRHFELPNSKLTVAYPSQDSARLPGVDIRVIDPDHAIELTHEDYFAGRDPVLEYVKQSLSTQ